MQAAFLVFLLGWGVADFLYTREIRFASMALFYAALSFQAQYAAARFAARGFRALELPAEPLRGETATDKQDEFNEDPIRVRPFAKARAPHYDGFGTAGSGPSGSQRAGQSTGAKAQELPPPRRASEPRPKATATDSASASAKSPRRPLGSSTPGFARAPMFSGRAHEILAIAENAATRTILSAFRHWIKRYHPDHTPEATAGEKARLLTQARNTLLEKRKRQARAA